MVPWNRLYKFVLSQNYFVIKMWFVLNLIDQYRINGNIDHAVYCYMHRLRVGTYFAILYWGTITSKDNTDVYDGPGEANICLTFWQRLQLIIRELIKATWTLFANNLSNIFLNILQCCCQKIIAFCQYLGACQQQAKWYANEMNIKRSLYSLMKKEHIPIKSNALHDALLNKRHFSVLDSSTLPDI